jgi:ASPIC/UnbV protein/VCBS repeat protein
MHLFRFASILGAAVLATPGIVAQSQTLRFDEVSLAMGITTSGNSFGAGAWGDFDGDGRPDLWLGNHANRPQLYWNTATSGLIDIVPAVWAGSPYVDTHGAAWADFDHDGDLDLLELVGGQGGTASHPNQFWLNQDLQLRDQAQLLGLDYPNGRGRTPLWLDWNHDGRLDVLLANLYRDQVSYSLPFAQAQPDPDGQASFVLDWPHSGFAPPASDNSYAQVADLTGDGQLDLVLQGAPYPLAVYDLSVQPMVNVLAQLGIPPTTWVRDSVIADFNGDLKNDFYLARYPMDGASEVALKGDDQVCARLLGKRGELGFQFASDGDLQISLVELVPPSAVHIGATGWSPSSIPFKLSPTDPQVVGMPTYTPGVDKGLFIGFNAGLARWHMMLSTPGRSDFRMRVVSNSTIEDLLEIGFDSKAYPYDRLLLADSGSFIDGTLNVAVRGQSVVAGDFDNDMDLDLYVVVSGAALNQQNVLYANQGDGTFVAIPGAGAGGQAGGAEGSEWGIGDSVSSVDFDQDGFLDLLVSNGEGDDFFADQGPLQLFRNLSGESGNSNHWLEIDLQAVADNRDAIGTRVIVQAGGIRQVREQNGGLHRCTQNHSRMHFGLAGFDRVERLEVQWPNGESLLLLDLPVDQLLHIQQGSPGLKPGVPSLMGAPQRAAFLWKETFDGPYRLTLSGAQSPTQFEASLVADQGLRSKRLAGSSDQSNSVWQVFPAGFHWRQTLQQQSAAVDFWLSPQSLAWLAIDFDQQNSAHLLSAGPALERLGQTGWLRHTADLAGSPSLPPGSGLAFGADASGTTLTGFWDGPSGLSSLSQLRSQFAVGIDYAQALDFEPGDLLQGGPHWASAAGDVDSNGDGLRMHLSEPQWVAWQFAQDGLHAPQRAYSEPNFAPNAVQIPLCTPYQEPVWSVGAAHELLVWKDPLSQAWSLRFNVPPGGNKRLSGSLLSNQAPLQLNSVGLEAGDQLQITPEGVAFDFTASNDFDGFDLWLPAGSSISLELNRPSNGQKLVQIGKYRWPIKELPLDLSGW